MGSVIGVKFGQKRNPTAICVAEAEDRQEATGTAWHFLARHLERLPLQTSFPKVADRVAQVAWGVSSRVRVSPAVYVDVTGLGEPVVDLIRERSSARVIATSFTYGDQRTMEGGRIRLGKAWLVSRLQTLLQTGRLHLPETAEARVLAEELLEFEIEIDEKADDRYGAFRVGSHDDLATALGLAVQEEPVTPVDWSRA